MSFGVDKYFMSVSLCWLMFYVSYLCWCLQMFYYVSCVYVDRFLCLWGMLISTDVLYIWYMLMLTNVFMFLSFVDVAGCFRPWNCFDADTDVLCLWVVLMLIDNLCYVDVSRCFRSLRCVDVERYFVKLVIWRTLNMSCYMFSMSLLWNVCWKNGLYVTHSAEKGSHSVTICNFLNLPRPIWTFAIEHLLFLVKDR